MKEFEANCSVIDVDFETIRHQGNIRAEGGNTEKQQVNTEKQEDSKEKKKWTKSIFRRNFLSYFFASYCSSFSYNSSRIFSRKSNNIYHNISVLHIPCCFRCFSTVLGLYRR